MPSSRIGQRMPAARPVSRSSVVQMIAVGVISIISLLVLVTVSLAPVLTGRHGHVAVREESSLAVSGTGLLVDVSVALGQMIEPVFRRVLVDLERATVGPPEEPTSVRAEAPGGAARAAVQERDVVPAGSTMALRMSDRQRAETEVAQAWSVLRQAQVEQARVLSTTEVVALQHAERDLAQAQSLLIRAQVDLERLRGPNPVMVEAAEREVQRAEATHRAALLARRSVDAGVADLSRDASVSSARGVLDDALARRDQIRSGPSPQEVEAARQMLSAAREARDAAIERLEVARQGVSQLTLDAANAAVLTARTDFAAAEARLRDVQADSR